MTFMVLDRLGKLIYRGTCKWEIRSQLCQSLLLVECLEILLILIYLMLVRHPILFYHSLLFSFYFFLALGFLLKLLDFESILPLYQVSMINHIANICQPILTLSQLLEVEKLQSLWELLLAIFGLIFDGISIIWYFHTCEAIIVSFVFIFIVIVFYFFWIYQDFLTWRWNDAVF